MSELFQIDEILSVTEGTFARSANARKELGPTSVCVDSRSAQAGSLFIALRGERTDGHLFVEGAFSRGATLSLVNRSFARENEEKFSQLAKSHGDRIIVVADTLAALQKLARFHLDRIHGVVTVGVTGSTGKTTTKEMIGSVLLHHLPGYMSPGNLNSEIGLPLSAFQVKQGHQYAIFEMGISHPGEMDDLVNIVRPDVAVITNIGSAHVEFLGSREGVASEKKKIFSKFDGAEVGFVYEDEPFFAFLSADVSGRIIPYGPRNTIDYLGGKPRGLDGWDLSFRWGAVHLPFIGSHNLTNALCAVSLASHLGVAEDIIREGLQNARPLEGRGRIIRGPVTVIEDSYNANPEAFRKAIDFFNSLPWEGRKAIVAGSMKELGEESESSHEALGEIAAASDADALFLFGEEMEAAFRRISGTAPMPVEWTAEFSELGHSVRQFLREGDLLLIKGSRGVELERLLPIVLEVPVGTGKGGHEC
ncbi:MAG TPA: UDP-N-acetylmuramoyl-tripeptide--D-alanyl-D-alanine ligase [Spirochaetia bacterium]|nr:UDP-N-acetylmuramoyl-tripeptide--D-alanyl-D-alanine ligase [Spirochaetia bacterium]